MTKDILIDFYFIFIREKKIKIGHIATTTTIRSFYETTHTFYNKRLPFTQNKTFVIRLLWYSIYNVSISEIHFDLMKTLLYVAFLKLSHYIKYEMMLRSGILFVFKSPIYDEY